MKAFWTTVLVLILIAGGLLIAGQIIATNKDYKNVIDWVKSWDVGKKKDTKEITVDNADETVTATIFIDM